MFVRLGIRSPVWLPNFNCLRWSMEKFVLSAGESVERLRLRTGWISPSTVPLSTTYMRSRSVALKSGDENTESIRSDLTNQCRDTQIIESFLPCVPCTTPGWKETKGQSNISCHASHATIDPRVAYRFEWKLVSIRYGASRMKLVLRNKDLRKVPKQSAELTSGFWVHRFRWLPTCQIDEARWAAAMRQRVGLIRRV